ncbi:MAG: hypothetical protein ACKOUK_00775 [Verrucomicrobiota bacterium]|nr:MAG: hypothetical protein B9S27_08045 [Opitutae bacterium Tous-C8FEB]
MDLARELELEEAARQRQFAILRALPPAERLRQAVRLNRTMRTLLAAGFRTRHPDWSEADIGRAVADRILYARTG